MLKLKFKKSTKKGKLSKRELLIVTLLLLYMLFIMIGSCIISSMLPETTANMTLIYLVICTPGVLSVFFVADILSQKILRYQNAIIVNRQQRDEFIKGFEECSYTSQGIIYTFENGRSCHVVSLAADGPVVVDEEKFAIIHCY